MKLKKLAKWTGIALVVAAVREELRKPHEQRDWYGRVGGVVPYDFRPPTADRIKDAMWNPQDERIFTDTVFGVGWSINLAKVKEKLAVIGHGTAA